MSDSAPDPTNDAGDPGGGRALDVGRIIQVASNGFIFLIIAEGLGVLLGGGLLVPLAAAVVYVYVGRKAARGRHRPMAHGAWAAGLSYALLIPLQFVIAANSDDPIFAPTMGEVAYRAVVSLALAFAIGAFAGRIEGRAGFAESTDSDP